MCSPAEAENNDGRTLTATASDWANYFPGYLANGHLSVLTDPRGSDSNLAFMAGLIDRTDGDIARPAAVPGFSRIDYLPTGDASSGVWLNGAPLDPGHFRDYRQTLDMREATLATRYTYVADGGRSTAIAITSFVSMAAPHLAATHFSITPDFDGVVTLKFALDKWAIPVPRLPLARLDWAEFDEALTAQNAPRRALPPAISDRAAAWYYGHVTQTEEQADSSDLSLRYTGRADGGVGLAEAITIALPPNFAAIDARARTGPYRSELIVRGTVRKGETYLFSKFTSVSRDGWGGDVQADLALAHGARDEGFDTLLAKHRRAWEQLWQADIRIDGDARAQAAVRSDLYYLLSSVPTDGTDGVGPCGLTTCYAGHVFWDQDSWVFPVLLLLHPDRARTLAGFRARTLGAAQERAGKHGFAGAMYPWEADAENGSEQIPHFAIANGDREIHIGADVAIAQWQYWLATQDRKWLSQHTWPVLREVANFYVSRARRNARGDYELEHVVSVDEDYSDVPNDTYTNLAAIKALNLARRAATLVGEHPDPRWKEVADRLIVPFDKSAQRHLEFDPSVPHDKDTWGGSSLPMLALPALDAPISEHVRRNDYEYALIPIRASHRDLNSMGLAPLSIMAATVGNTNDAARWFEQNFTGGVLKPPFNVRSETAGNNTGPFITASAGLLQNVVLGFTGLRLEDQGLVAKYPPMLPPQWRRLTLEDVQLRGRHYRIVLQRDTRGKVVMSRRPR